MEDRSVRAIPTRYKGIQFKSRLEARWAVAFDLLRIKWAYEPLRLTTGYQGYHPDFGVYDAGISGFELSSIVEVKPKRPSEVEISKVLNSDWCGLRDAGTTTTAIFNAYLVSGLPGEHDCLAVYETDMDHMDMGVGSIRQCPFCGRVKFCDPDQSGLCDCVGVLEFAERFDLIDWFHDTSQTTFPSLSKSPILCASFDIARKISFDSPNFAERLARETEIVDELFSSRCFGTTDAFMEIVLFAIQWKVNGNDSFLGSSVYPGVGYVGWTATPYLRQHRRLTDGRVIGGSDPEISAAFLARHTDRIGAAEEAREDSEVVRQCQS